MGKSIRIKKVIVLNESPRKEEREKEPNRRTETEKDMNKV